MSGTVTQTTLQSDRPSSVPCVILILVFLAFNLPVVGTFHRYFGDERAYVDAAIHMYHSGNYLSPTDSKGHLYYYKPAITYWIIAASYKLLGVSLFASRLPFLLLGCFNLFLTWRLAWILFRDQSIATLGAAMLLGNVLFNHIANFSLTEEPLLTAMLLSQYGFIKILFCGSRRHRDYLLGYAGAGMAVAIKGVMGVTPVVMAWAFAIWRKYLDRNSSRAEAPAPWILIHIPFMLLGALFAVGWVLLMWAVHGSEFVDIFMNDQMLGRFAHSTWQSNLLYYPAGYLEYFLPWYLPVIVFLIADRQGLKLGFSRHRDKFIYLLGWTFFQYIFYVPGNISRSRYMLAAYPFVAIFLAAWLISSNAALLARIWRKLAVGLSILLLLAGGAAIWLGQYLAPSFATGGMLIAASAIVFLVLSLRFQRALPYLLAALVCGELMITDMFLRDCFNSTPSMQAAEVLKTIPAPEPEVVIVSKENEDFAAQLRQCLAENVRVSFEEDRANLSKLSAQAIIFTDRDTARLNLGNYRVVPLASAYKAKAYGEDSVNFSFLEFIKAVRSGNAEAYLKKTRYEIFLAVRRQ